MAHTMWTVRFYKDAQGRVPAREFLQTLSPKEYAALLRTIDLLQEMGIALQMPHARRVDELWELRAGPGRLFYFAYAGRQLIILHGYRKKTQKTPARELATAKRRWIDFLERNQ